MPELSDFRKWGLAEFGYLHRWHSRRSLISDMKLVSVNVGLPRLLAWGGSTFKTSIFKHAVEGRVMLRTNNLDGDRQADLSVHGGVDKAVYGYPSEHYPAWNAELPELPDFARTGEPSARTSRLKAFWKQTFSLETASASAPPWSE
jgi:hypothetical protein